MGSLRSYVLVLLSTLFIVGCSNGEPQFTGGKAESVEPVHTGNELFEPELNPLATIVELEDGRQVMAILDLNAVGSPEQPVEELQKMYVQGTRVRVRTSPEILDDNIAGVLYLNDLVEVVNPEVMNGFVEINILDTKSEIQESEKYYFSYQYLGDEKNDARKYSASPYFMIQNIATEKIRVYKKECDSGCAHTLVFETDMVAGEHTKSGSTMTYVGYYHISKWYKFYQDGAGVYPSWYHPSYPMPPKAGAGVLQWTKKKYMPVGYSKKGVRGAFGWYTAHVAPNSHYQWTHGTIGWGSDGDKYIKKTRGAFANMFANPRSHGCSRTDNEAIAYLREILPVGTPLLKIYALEALADADKTRYTEEKKAWNYILTKQGAREDGQKADRENVIASGSAQSEWLDQGEYEVDAYPDMKGFSPGTRGSKSSKNGNVYALDLQQMKGYFLIDEGRVVNYSHPAGLGRGGYMDEVLPTYVFAPADSTYTLPKKTLNSMKSKSKKRDRSRRRR